MTFEEAFQDVADYLWKEYPTYNGWRIRKFAWEYNTCSLASEIFFEVQDKFDAYGDIEIEDVEKHIQRTQPPEGFAYVTLERNGVCVGFNVPCHVFQKE